MTPRPDSQPQTEGRMDENRLADYCGPDWSVKCEGSDEHVMFVSDRLDNISIHIRRTSTPTTVAFYTADTEINSIPADSDQHSIKLAGQITGIVDAVINLLSDPDEDTQLAAVDAFALEHVLGYLRTDPSIDLFSPDDGLVKDADNLIDHCTHTDSFNRENSTVTPFNS